MVGAVRQCRRHPYFRFDDFLQQILVVKHHVLDGVAASLERHAVGARREAMHRSLLVQRMCFIDDGVEFLLREVAHVWLFLVGPAAARCTSLDHVRAVAKVQPRELAQFPGTVRTLKTVAFRGARKNELKVRAGHVGKARHDQARAGQHAGVDGVAHRAHGFGHQATRALLAKVTQCRKTHLETELRVKEGVHLLQMRRDFPLGHAIILEGAVVEHAEMDVQVHHSLASACNGWHQRLRYRPEWRSCPCRQSI